MGALGTLLLVLGSAAPAARAGSAAAVQVSTPTFSRVVTAVSPSIVSVTAKRKSWSASGAPESLFGDGEAGLPPGPSLGSGVIVSSDGFIVTNSHVIEGADEIKVALSSGAEVAAKVVGRDPKTDIAVLKIEHAALTPAAFGDSSKTAIGDVVLALGYPFGIGQTVTMGIISATGRGNIGLEDYEDFLQTDAAINPGNSGGALVDTEGRVIGINTAILSRTGGNQGIGFAVPSNLARHVVAGLVADGRVARGFLGLTVQDLTPALAKHFAAGQGALVADVVRGGPADRAGLRPGDIVTAFDGRPVRDGRTLRLQAGQLPPNRAVDLSLRRGARDIDTRVVLRDQSVEPATAAPVSAAKPFAGALLEELTADSRGKLQISNDVHGVLVAAIQRGSPAHESGLRPGDVITEVGRRSVRTVRDVWRAAQAADRALLLRVWQDGGTHYVVIEG